MLVVHRCGLPETLLLSSSVEAFETELCPGGQEAGVNEQRALAHVRHRQSAQGSPQLAVWTESASQRRAAGHMVDLPSLEPWLYWLHDASPGKQHTLAFIDRSLKLGVAVLRKGTPA